MEIEYDAVKAESNYRKHRVHFEDAAGTLEDGDGLTVADTVSDPNEVRFATVGMSYSGHLLTVVYTMRGKAYRLISARKATHQKRKQYEGDYEKQEARSKTRWATGLRLQQGEAGPCDSATPGRGGKNEGDDPPR